MKRESLALLLVFLMAYSACADIAWNFVVNDKPIDKPIVMVEDTAYVQWAVADTFNATTDWNFQTQTITIKTKQIDPQEIKRPPIKGDKEFVAKVNAALDLLEQKDFPHYWMVCQNTRSINQIAQNQSDERGDFLSGSFSGVTFITRCYLIIQAL